MEDRARSIVEQGNLPQHVAIIMDGNGRWAERRDEPRIAGHRAGMKSVRDVLEAAGDLGIPWLTLYAFSQENWKRPRLEVDALMELLRGYIRSERAELERKGVRVQAIGELDKLVPRARKEVARIIADTAGNERLTVTLALSYGGRAELVEAARRLGRRVRDEALDPEAIDEQLLASQLYTVGQPDPDLLIRTSGEMRLSNFLLWQIAYTELYVTDVLWPDFGRGAFFDAIAAYQDRERRFGAVPV